MMTKRLIVLFAVLAVVLAGAGALLFAAHSSPSTVEIGVDIARVEHEIKGAKAEDQSYSGGFRRSQSQSTPA